MAVHVLGTVLPTVASERAGDLAALRHAQARQAVAEQALTAYTRREVEGETRYYDGDTRFAVVGRDLKIKWFEYRDGNWYAVTVTRRIGR